jgi:hypothetical protein
MGIQASGEGVAAEVAVLRRAIRRAHSRPATSAATPWSKSTVVTLKEEYLCFLNRRKDLTGGPIEGQATPPATGPGNSGTLRFHPRGWPKSGHGRSRRHQA